LSIARRLAQLMGGWVDLEHSVVGEGSTFVAWLPLGEAEALGGADPESAGAPDGLRVLVVEDDPAVRRVVCAMVENLGHEVCEAGGLVEAREVGWADHDHVLLDLRLGDGDGLDLAREMLSSGESPPITIVTGEADPVLRATARSMGVRGVLAKPVTRRQRADALADAPEADLDR
jgi:CheY-like chemotaxis protein